MIDETSAIIGLDGAPERNVVTSEASTTTWETIVEQYRERAVRDGARIDEMMQRANHWHDTADMLKRQRDMAEQERDAWKLRAMKAEQERQAVCAERDALRDAMRKDVARLDWMDARTAFLLHQWQGGGYTLTVPQPPVDGVRPVPVGFTGATLREAIDAALAVQPTTGGEDE
jgi:hypothetical protein